MAAISKVSIFNMATSAVGGRSTIEAEDEASAEASACRLWYDRARRQALEANNWDFARRRQPLALHADDPPADWGYRYQFPANAIIVRELWNPAGASEDAVPFEVELSEDGGTKSIFTNLESAIAIYTMDQEATGLFSEMFIEALAHFLASKIAPSLTGDRKIVLQELQIAQTLIAQAAASNANQGAQAPPRDADWIRGRV